jgi:hypothetical protein
MTNIRCFVYLVCLIISCFVYLLSTNWYVTKIYLKRTQEISRLKPFRSHPSPKPTEQDRVFVLNKENEKLAGQIKQQNAVIKKLSQDLAEQQELLLAKELLVSAEVLDHRPTFITFFNGSSGSMDSLRNLVGVSSIPCFNH